MQTTKGVKWIDANGIERDLDTEIAKIDFTLAQIRGIDAVSWATIDALAQQDMASSTFRVGEEKHVTLSTGETLTFVILGFNHDNLAVGGKAKITFGMKNITGTLLNMNDTGTNAGGWGSSVMRTSTMPDLFSKLPADLQAVIKPVNKQTSVGVPSFGIGTSQDSLFLLSEYELTGLLNYAYGGEGTQYEYYQGGVNANFIKKIGNGAGPAMNWWLRSPYFNNSTYFCSVTATGVSTGNVANMANGVSFCFCV